MDYAANTDKGKLEIQDEKTKFKGEKLRGKVKKKKKSKAEKTVKRLFGKDLNMIGQQIENQIERNAMTFFSGALHGAVDAFFGSSGRGGRSLWSDREDTDRRYVRYNSGRPSYDARDMDVKSVPSRSKIPDYDDFIFSNYDDAYTRFKELKNRLKTYKHVSIGDYYELMNEPCPYTYYEWGWRSLEAAFIDETKNGGWVIRFPEPRPIDIR